MRVLVVGGLAGAAWLLTGAAAHAADRSDGPTGSLLGSIVDGDVTAPVSGLLTAAARPLEVRPAHHHRHHVVADILEVPQRVLTRPVETVGEIAHDTTSGATVDAVTGGIDPAPRDVDGPHRLTGGKPADTRPRLTAVPDEVAATDAEPVTERPQQAAVAPSQAASPQVPAALPSHVRIVKAPIAETGPPARHLEAPSAKIAYRLPVTYRAVAGPASAREDTPGGDGPAPLQLHLGDVSGTPTSGSGVRTEGGSAAFLPVAIASSTMACQRLPIASDVEVRRCDAEAPTVSPD